MSQCDAKRLSTAIARAALQGIVLQAIEGDDGRAELVASAGATTFRFRDLAGVETWLSQQAEAHTMVRPAPIHHRPSEGT